jgi:hypothetical protein
MKLIPLLLLPALILLTACGGTTELTPNVEALAALPTPNPGAVADVPWVSDQQGDMEGQLESLFTISDIESIGFEKTEDATSNYDLEHQQPHLLEAWEGEILVNGASQLVAVFILDEAVDESTKELMTQLGLILGYGKAVIHNVAILCLAQEGCDYVIEKLR